jgi:hypothetical protein
VRAELSARHAQHRSAAAVAEEKAREQRRPDPLASVWKGEIVPMLEAARGIRDGDGGRIANWGLSTAPTGM